MKRKRWMYCLQCETKYMSIEYEIPTHYGDPNTGFCSFQCGIDYESMAEKYLNND